MFNTFADARRWLRCWWAERQLSTPADSELVDLSVRPPPEVARRLIDDNQWRPLWPEFRRYGPGPPGVIQETNTDWVIRSGHGCAAGGARVILPNRPGDPISIDIAIDPRYRRRGFATRLYEALERGGIDVEAGSDASMRFGTMTRLGYAFMVGRRARKRNLKDRG